MANESSAGPSNEQAKKAQAQEPSKRAGGATGRESGEPKAEERRGLSRGGAYAPAALDIGPWNVSPFSLMRRMMDDLDRLFDEVGNARSGASPDRPQRGFALGAPSWVPQLDVVERDGRLVVRADLPGTSKDDVRVEVTEDALVIEGERRQEREVEGEGIHRAERSYGSFQRVIPLPEGVNAEAAEARFENGVLEVTIPIEEERRRGRRIEIQEGGKSQGGKSSNVH